MSSTSLSKQQLAKLRAKIGEVDADEGRFLKYLAARWRDEGIKRLGDIPARNFDEAVAVLEAKRRDPSKPWTLNEMLEVVPKRQFPNRLGRSERVGARQGWRRLS